MSPLRLLLPTLLFATALPCQDPVEGRDQAIEERIKERERRAEEGRDPSKLKNGMTAEEISEAEMRNLTPEERLARTVKANTAGQCRFVATIKPEKLMPGQAGTMVITALLNGQAVIPFPAPVEVLTPRKQGLVDLGELTVLPAETGTLQTAYRGRPVYDNFAVMEVPVVMSPTAEIGKKQQVALQLRFDIYDGATAQPIGRFVDRVSAEVEVGQKIDPAVQGAKARTADPSGSAPTPESQLAPATNVEGDTVPDHRVVEGSVPAPLAATPEAVPAQSAPPSHDWSGLQTDDGIPMPVWIGGGVALLLLIVMLARKKS